MLLARPSEPLLNKTLRVGAEPDVESVPLIVIGAKSEFKPKKTVEYPSTAEADTERLFNVTGPLMVLDAAVAVDVKDKLFKVTAVVEATVEFELVAIIFDVPALKVRPMPASEMAVVPPRVSVLDPRLTVLTLESIDKKLPAVTLKLDVVKMPFCRLMFLVPTLSASARTKLPLDAALKLMPLNV